MTQLDRAVARLEAAEGSGGRAEREAQQHRRLRDIARQIAARVDNAPAWIDLALRGAG